MMLLNILLLTLLIQTVQTIACKDEFDFKIPVGTGILEESRSVQNAAFGCASGPRTVISSGGNYLTFTGTNTANRLYKLHTSGTNIFINNSTGEITANTNTTYTETARVEYCCEEVDGTIGGDDCRTSTDSITITSCNCSVSGLSFSRPSGLATTHKFGPDA